MTTVSYEIRRNSFVIPWNNNIALPTSRAKEIPAKYAIMRKCLKTQVKLQKMLILDK